MMDEKLLLAKGRNWAKLVTERADLLCELRKNEPDLMVQILSGDLFNEAVNQIALEIKTGLYDKMLMPKGCNL